MIGLSRLDMWPEDEAVTEHNQGEVYDTEDYE